MTSVSRFFLSAFSVILNLQKLREFDFSIEAHYDDIYTKAWVVHRLTVLNKEEQNPSADTINTYIQAKLQKRRQFRRTVE